MSSDDPTKQNATEQNSEQNQPDSQPDQPEEASTEADVQADINQAELKQQLDNVRDELLRSQAEMHNLRRRTERDVANAHKFALDKFVAELLPVVDNLERAIAAEQSASEGITLTLKTFTDVLTRFNVEQIDPVGEPFDPELHQAMSMVPNPDMENNSVLEVFQKGYSLNGRLVRPAMVVVVKN